MNLAYALLLLFAILGDFLDAYISDRGIRKGVAIEGNEMITFFFGNKPTLWELMLFNMLITAAIAIPGALGICYENLAVLRALSIGGFVADGARGIQRYFQWKKLGA